MLSHYTHAQLLATQWTIARLLCSWDSPGKNTGMGCHALLQGIFPTLGSNPGLPNRRQILYQLSHQGSPHQLTLSLPADILLIFKSQLLFLLIYEDLEGKDYEQGGWDYSGTQKYLHL